LLFKTVPIHCNSQHRACGAVGAIPASKVAVIAPHHQMLCAAHFHCYPSRSYSTGCTIIYSSI